MDCSFVTGGEGTIWDCPVVKAWVGDHPVQAILDSGCAQSLVRVSLVTSHRGHEAELVKVSCLHGETKRVCCQWVPLRVMEHWGELLVGLVPRLTCDMLLRQDWTTIYDTLERIRDVETRHSNM